MDSNFLWGGAIAANQAEGGFDLGGRLPSNTDYIPSGKMRLPVMASRINPFELPLNTYYPSRTGVNMYEMYLNDIEMLAEMGIKVFRMSISWSRIFPKGDEKEPNKEGLEFYRKIFEKCKYHNIQPLVTLNHFDCPIHLTTEYGSWRNRSTIDFFVNYATKVMTEFKDLVEYWITFNEINMGLYIPFGYCGVLIDENENRDEIKFQYLHHQLIASALVTKLAHEINPNNKIGCMFAAGAIYPYSCNPKDIFEAINVEKNNSYLIDVQVRGQYPNYFLKKLESTGIEIKIEQNDKEILMNGKVDFIGLSYYSSKTVEASSSKESTSGNAFSSTKNPYLEQTQWGWEVDPLGLRITLNQLYDKYQIPLFIVENGLGAVDKLTNETVLDTYRIKYLEDHILSMMEAVELDGVELIGYTTWSCIDLVSAGSGEVSKRYGFIYVDVDDLGNGTFKRYKKESFNWYKKVIESNGEILKK